MTLLDDVDDGDAGPGPGAAGVPDVEGQVAISSNVYGCLGRIFINSL